MVDIRCPYSCWVDSESESFEDCYDCDIDHDSNDVVVEQFVQDVLDFSSQYGSDISISYTAYNISGKPSKYPDYGDFPQAFVMRTYGNWWNQAPSRPISIMPQNSTIPSQDYIDVLFEMQVLPLKVSIYETYNPGSVVRIWAGDENGRWALLWEGPSQTVDHGPRIFSPEISPIHFPTNLLRVEFDHSKLDYYTELDAILLIGSCPSKTPKHEMGKLVSHIKALNINAASNETDMNNALMSLSSLAQHYSNILKDINEDLEASKGCSSGPFNNLPDETILRIFSYLDLISLSSCRRVNKHFRRLASDSLLYTELNLKPYWHRVNSSTLDSLADLCHYLQKLDFSWCGNYDQVSSEDLNRFIASCGRQITHLRFDCCKFLNDDTMKEVASSCPVIRELSIKNCLKITKIGFDHLGAVTTFTRLDMYRTSIVSEPLVKILKANPNLQHINLGSCVSLANMDEVATALGTYCKNLISADFWKTYSLTPPGFSAIANCSKLEEIDLGWCLGVSIPGDTLTALANGCPKLKKLFLAALRGITDRDLVPFLLNCPHLQQIDLLGVRSISSQMCLRFLMTMKELKLFDLSFCDQIHEETVTEWRKNFPHVSIKRSFQSDGLPSPFQHY